MSEASKRIRDSIAALPEGVREPWSSRYEDVRAPIHDGGTSYMHVAIAEDDFDDLGGHAVAAHIALLASPHVAAAVADLLDAHARLAVVDAEDVPRADKDISDQMLRRIACWRVVKSAVRALEAAITREA